MNGLLIPTFSYDGAAIANVAFKLFAFTLCSLVFSKSVAPSSVFRIY